MKSSNSLLSEMAKALNGIKARLDKVDARITGVQEEMRRGFADVRNEMKTGFAEVRAEMKTGLSEVRSEMSAGFDGVEAHLKDHDSSFETVLTQLSDMDEELTLGRQAPGEKTYNA